MATTWQLDDGVFYVAMTGRLVEADVEVLDEAVAAVADTAGGVAVVYDRLEMGAPTSEGQRALVAWAEEALPALVERVTAWADVLPTRVIAAVDRAAERDGHAHDEHDHAYPQRSFDDVAAAHAWVRAVTTSA